MLIQLKYRGIALRGAAGQLAVAVLCGSIVAACSGTIDTPTEENPPRSGNPVQAPAANAPNRPAPTPSAQTPAEEDEEEEEEDEETPAAPPPGAAVEPEDPQEEEPAAPTGPLSFASDIWPVFNGKCGPCHVSVGLGGQNIGAPDKDSAFEESVDFEDEVLAEIADGTMPPVCGGGAPGDPGCLTVAEAATVEAWYDEGAPE